MRKYFRSPFLWTAILIGFSSIPILSGGLEQKNNSDMRHDALSYLKTKVPAVYEMMRYVEYARQRIPFSVGTYDSKITLGSKFDWIGYIDSTNLYNRFTGLDIAVHESCHFFTTLALMWLDDHHRINEKILNRNWYLYPLFYKKAVLAPLTVCFPARKIDAIFPKDFPAFSYKNYILGIPIATSTQVDGIYGLLDEWNAYIHDAQVILSFSHLWPFENGQWVKYWINLHSNVLDPIYSFALYIQYYLKFARTRNPVVYHALCSNKAFVTALAQIRNLADGTLKKTFTILDSAKTYWKNHGLTKKYGFDEWHLMVMEKNVKSKVFTEYIIPKDTKLPYLRKYGNSIHEIEDLIKKCQGKQKTSLEYIVQFETPAKMK